MNDNCPKCAMKVVPDMQHAIAVCKNPQCDFRMNEKRYLSLKAKLRGYDTVEEMNEVDKELSLNEKTI